MLGSLCMSLSNCHQNCHKLFHKLATHEWNQLSIKIHNYYRTNNLKQCIWDRNEHIFLACTCSYTISFLCLICAGYVDVNIKVLQMAVKINVNKFSECIKSTARYQLFLEVNRLIQSDFTVYVLELVTDNSHNFRLVTVLAQAHAVWGGGVCGNDMF